MYKNLSKDVIRGAINEAKSFIGTDYFKVSEVKMFCSILNKLGKEKSIKFKQVEGNYNNSVLFVTKSKCTINDIKDICKRFNKEIDTDLYKTETMRDAIEVIYKSYTNESVESKLSKLELYKIIKEAVKACKEVYKKKCDELHYEANIDTTGIGFTILSYFNDENDDYVDFIEGYSKSLPIGSYDYYCAIDKIKGKDKYEYSNNIADILDAIESCKSDKWKIEIDGNTAEGDINLVLK